MNTTNAGRAEARSRATRRLRNLTIGTALLGLAGTGTLGWVAAATYNGSGLSSDLAAAVVTTTGTDQTGATGNTASAGAAPVVTGTSGRAHVSSGGS